MSDKEIENLLRTLPQAELPSDWRAPILRGAMRAASGADSSAAGWPPVFAWTGLILRKNPITSLSLAVMWLLILLFRCTTPIDLQEREIVARANSMKPLQLMRLEDEIRLVDALERPAELSPARVP